MGCLDEMGLVFNLHVTNFSQWAQIIYVCRSMLSVPPFTFRTIICANLEPLILSHHLVISVCCFFKPAVVLLLFASIAFLVSIISLYEPITLEDIDWMIRKVTISKSLKLLLNAIQYEKHSSEMTWIDPCYQIKNE